MTTLELKEKRAAAQSKMEQLLNKAKKESRSLNADEQKQFDDLKAEVRSFDDKIDALESWLREQKAPKKVERKFSFVSAINAMREGRDFEAPEAEISEIGAAGSTPSGEGRSLWLPMQKRAALQATITAAGKEDVATDLLDIVTPLENSLIATQAGCTFLTGLRGNIEIPFYTGSTAGWAGEVADASDGAGKFKKKSLEPKRITGYVDISKQLLVQGNDSVEQLIQRSLVNAVRQTLEGTMFGNAAGTDAAPEGLLKGVTAETAAITYGKLVDMETALLKNNFTNLTWVAAYDALGILKQTEKVTGYPVYLYDNGQIDGRKVFASNNVTNKALVLGDFSELTIGQWGGIELLVDPYTQALKGSVRLIVNAYFNYFVRRGFNSNGTGIVPFGKIVLK